MINDLIDDDSSGDVDGLFSVGGGVCRFEGLLTPKRFTADGFAADIHGEHLEEGVCFVVAAAESEEEGLEDAVGDGFGDDVLDVSGAKGSGWRSVVEEGREFGGDFGENILWWVDGEVGEMFVGEGGD
jgi:hypothetical protein